MSQIIAWLRHFSGLIIFGLVGGLSTLTYATLALAGAHVLPWPGAVVSLGAYCIAGTVSYMGHRCFTFQSRRNHAVAVPRFIQLFIIGNCVAFLIPLVMSDWGGLPRWASVAMTCITIPALNAFVLSRHVFGTSLFSGQPLAGQAQKGSQ